MAQYPVAGAAETLSAQLKYLTDAAHLIAVNAPSCSAHLMSVCNLIAFSNDIEQSDSQRKHVCGGCGNIMGWSSEVKNEVQQQQQQYRRSALKRKKERATEQPTESFMVRTCGRCKRETRHVIHRMETRRIAPRREEQASLGHGHAPERLSTSSQSRVETLAGLSANASSKKRAKSRKQGSLQALLAKNKEASQSSNSGFGLDLLDLMKHS